MKQLSDFEFYRALYPISGFFTIPGHPRSLDNPADAT